MASQITGAAVWHVNTTCVDTVVPGWGYSDHDPYLVALNLGGDLPETCTDIDFTESFAANLGDFTPISVSGDHTWVWNSSYLCAYMNAYGATSTEDNYLVSPAFDFTDQKSGIISFTHTLGYGASANWPSQCTLLISDDYTTDATTASWTQLTIPNWPSSNWNWQENQITIPAAFMRKSNVHFAFHYYVDSNVPAWEIKDLSVQTVCEKNPSTGWSDIISTAPQARKEIRHGQLLIIRGGEAFTVTGQRVY